MEIKENYISENEIVTNVRNVNFDNIEDFRKNRGNFIAESRSNENSGFSLDEDGIYLFKSLYDKTKALRVYKDYNLYQHTGHPDHKIVSELQKRQPNIKLTEFPTGILTIENKIIGQEIPLYENSKTILEYFKEGNMKKRPTQFYLEILYILKELYNEGIIYMDVHKKNFLINKITEMVNIIDFEQILVNFDNSKWTYENMVVHFKTCLVDVLNSIININFNVKFKMARTLEELEEALLEEDYKLKIKQF